MKRGLESVRGWVVLAAVALTCGACVSSSSQVSTTTVPTTTTIQATTTTTTIDYEEVCGRFAEAWVSDTTTLIYNAEFDFHNIIFQHEMRVQVLGNPGFSIFVAGVEFEDFAKRYREKAIYARDKAFDAPGLVPEAYRDLAEVYHLYADAGLLGAAAGAERSEELLKDAERKFLDAEIAWAGIDWRCDPTP